MIRKFTLLCGLILFIIGCKERERPTEGEVKPGEFYVDIYDSSKAYNGTTLFTDSHDSQNLRIVEVNMQGETVWEYIIPQNMVQGQPIGLDAELLDNGNILLVLTRSGLYEIDRNGNIVWSHLDPKVSHDADRLSNGNTIYVFGANDKKGDAQVKEVDSQGNLVWFWYAKDHYNVPPYDTIDYQGWTHTNAVTRLENGNTLINIRNFDLTVEVDSQGNPVWEFKWQDLYPVTNWQGLDPHEPEILPNNHLLVCLQWETPYQVVEIDRTTGQPVWEYYREGLRTARDADRLPNGNTLIVGVLQDTQDSVIFEVTPEKEIVWQLKLKDTPATGSPGWFYKAQRIGTGN